MPNEMGMPLDAFEAIDPPTGAAASSDRVEIRDFGKASQHERPVALTKMSVLIRLDNDVIGYFRDPKVDWHHRVNKILRDAMARGE